LARLETEGKKEIRDAALALGAILWEYRRGLAEEEKRKK